MPPHVPFCAFLHWQVPSQVCRGPKLAFCLTLCSCLGTGFGSLGWLCFFLVPACFGLSLGSGPRLASAISCARCTMAFALLNVSSPQGLPQPPMHSLPRPLPFSLWPLVVRIAWTTHQEWMCLDHAQQPMAKSVGLSSSKQMQQIRSAMLQMN